MVRRSLSSSRIETPESSTEPTHINSCLEMSERKTIGKPIPQQPFGQSGQILSRTTASSKLLRKWQGSYWVHLLPATIVIFRNEQDFQKWAAEQSSGDYTARRKHRKVLLFVDFDTLGILTTGHNNNLEQRGLNSNSLLSNSKGSSAKLVSKLQKYALGDVTTTLVGTQPL